MKLLNFILGNFRVLLKYLFCKNTLWNGTNVDFLWNRKFAEICSVYPVYFPYKIVPKKFFRLLQNFFNYVSYMNINKKISNNNLVYVSLDNMDFFKVKVLKKIQNDFILITGDSDFTPSMHKDLLDCRYLKVWFAQNCDLKNPKLHSLPIGLDYHTISSYPFWGSSRLEAIDQERELKEIMNDNSPKLLKIFTNFHININSERRRVLYDKLKDSSFFSFQEKPLARLDTWKEQKKYYFVFSPAGVGADCHRTWEALLLGCIPIVESSFLDDFYSDFPIVIIKDTDELTEENLIKWKNMYKDHFNDELNKKLNNSFWIEKINNTISSMQ